MMIHTYKTTGGKDYHYINGELAFVDGRPQPRYAGSTENAPKRKSDEEME